MTVVDSPCPRDPPCCSTPCGCRGFCADDGSRATALLAAIRGTVAPSRLDELEDALLDLPESGVSLSDLLGVFTDLREPGQARAAALMALLHHLVAKGRCDKESRVRDVARDADVT